MEMRADWSEKAIEDLSAILDFYKGKEGKKRAMSIIEYVDRLIVMPKLGKMIPETKNRAHPFRILIDDVYKIIYYIDGPYIHIVGIFDCRQDIKKLKKLF